MEIQVTLEGMQLLQDKAEDLIRTIGPHGEMPAKWVHYATEQAYHYAVGVTHVDTGSLQASHRMKVSAMRGMVYIDPSAVNWKYPGQMPSVYGPIEHNRGGAHAFYARTVQEMGPTIMEYAHYLVKVVLA